MDQTRLTESAEYTARRDELRLAEIELMRQRERVAALRRQLPAGTPVTDYLFAEGPARLDDGDDPVSTVRLSGLFTAPDRPLVIYHLMYGKAQRSPCPMCTMWIDGFNGIARHLAPNVDFAVAAAADVGPLRAHARARGWDQLRLLSCAGSTFKYDLGSEDADGAQESTVSVFTLDPPGRRATSTPPTRTCRGTSRSAGSTCSRRPGMCSTSLRRGGTTGTRSSSTPSRSADDRQPPRQAARWLKPTCDIAASTAPRHAKSAIPCSGNHRRSPQDAVRFSPLPMAHLDKITLPANSDGPLKHPGFAPAQAERPLTRLWSNSRLRGIRADQGFGLGCRPGRPMMVADNLRLTAGRRSACALSCRTEAMGLAAAL